MERQRREADRNRNNVGVWSAVGAVAGIGALVGGAYWMTRKNPNVPSANMQQQQNPERRGTEVSPASNCTTTSSTYTGTLRSISGYLSSLLQSTTLNGISDQRSVPRSAVPMYPDITNLNSLLSDIDVRFIQLKNEDFQLYYNVFMDVFFKLHEAMKQVDTYYNRYSSTISFAGSHYDRLRIKKPDEFDMDIVISLPPNYNITTEDPSQSDIVLQPNGSGFSQLIMGIQYENLPLRDGVDWLVNRQAYEWRDECGFILQSNFINWFKSVVVKAQNSIGWTYCVGGVSYRTRLSESGPACTMIIENVQRGFRLDVDLVPALRFPESLWPPCTGYRAVPLLARCNYWYLVPKPNKAAYEIDQTSSWRISLQDQEREMMKNLQNCKQVIRLLKMLRDAQGMKKITNYYIKTLFLWQIVERDDPAFWRKSPAELFTIMVAEFFHAMVRGSIPYFWDKNNNLLAGIEIGYLLNTCSIKLAELKVVLEQPTQYKQVARFLLSQDDFAAYNAQYLHI